MQYCIKEQFCPHCGHVLTYMAKYDDDYMFHCENCLKDWYCEVVYTSGCYPMTSELKQKFWG